MKSNPLAWRFISLWSLVLLVACSTKTKNLDTAEGTMIEGERLLKEEFFEEARTQFFRIKSEFPTSPLQVKADLRIADSYFAEESFPAAATAYEDFIRTYPGREETPYAMFRLGMSHAKQVPDNYQRDSHSTEKAVDVFARLLVDYPNSEYRDQALEWVNRAQDQLARKAFHIANFYEKQKKDLSAAIRYERMAESFPDHPLAEEALAKRIVLLKKAGKTDNLPELIESFNRQFPDSKFKTMIAP